MANDETRESLLTELRQGLRREEATRRILDVIQTSRDDEGPVFETILTQAAELCEASQASLQLANAERTQFEIAAYWGFEETAFSVGGSAPLDSGRPIPEAIRTGRTVNIPDLSDTDFYRNKDPIISHVVEDEGVRSWLVVPLMKGPQAIGAIALSRKIVRPFDGTEIHLVEGFAAQAVIAIENVHQFREVQTHLEQERATGEVLQVISRSRHDELPVFQTILANASRLCGADRARLMMANNDGTGLLAAAQWGEANPALPDGAVIEMVPEMLPVRCMIEQKTINVRDGRETEGYKKGVPQVVANIDAMQARSVLAVPLLSGGEAIGCIVLTSRKIAAYDNNDAALVETFAAQAVIAIENVRQFRELQERFAREKASTEVLDIISRSRADEQPVFDIILESASRLCHAPLALLHLTSNDRKRVRCAAYRGTGDEFASRLSDFDEDLESSKLVVVEAIRSASVIQVDDLADDALYHSGNDWRRRIVDEEGARSFVSVPLLSGAQAVGTITLYRREVLPFADDDISVVKGFTAQAVIAIENARQFKELQSLNAELGERVDAQVGEIERMGKLKRFLPSAVADTVISSGSDKMLSSHRALLGVLFCDIRGFTAFCETAEPEETIEVLQTYHEEMGKLINAHGAGVDHRMGDGIMVLFNDPIPREDPAGDAVRLALAMRARMRDLSTNWKRMGFRLGFGVGVSLGYATVGMVGYEGRSEYTASGTSINVASRLCELAEDGEILLSTRAAVAVEDDFPSISSGEFTLKGIREPIEVFSLDHTGNA